MKKSLCMALGLLLSHYIPDVQSAEENQYQKNTNARAVSPAAQPVPETGWQVKTGLLFETENVEGSGDGKGAWEPTLFVELTADRWTVYGSFYQEDHNTGHYYRSAGRTDGYDQYEITTRYHLLTGETLSAGLLAGARNYHWSYDKGDKKGQRYDTQRYTLQPDWDLRLTPDLHFSGWLAGSHYENNVRNNGLTAKELEGESGLAYTINDNLGITLNYYIDRGWHSNNLRDGEFSQQELRLYFPVTLSLLDAGESRFTPYIRRSLSTRYYNSERQRNERERDTRFGLLFEQSLPHNLSLSLEYGYELQLHPQASASEPSRTKFHYTGVGLNYAF